MAPSQKSSSVPGTQTSLNTTRVNNAFFQAVKKPGTTQRVLAAKKSLVEPVKRQEQPGRDKTPIARDIFADLEDVASVNLKKPDIVPASKTLVPALDLFTELRATPVQKPRVTADSSAGDIHIGIHQVHLSRAEKTLRQFDLSSKYGPSIDLTRQERWDRAHGLGLYPPTEVKDLLAQFPSLHTSLFQGRV